MDNRVEIKSVDDDKVIVAGYGVVFGGRDLEGDVFTAETDFMLDYVPTKAVFYDHSQRPEPELNDPIGRVVKMTQDEKGLWIEAELERSASYREYIDAILELAGKGALGWSSGSVGHLVRREEKNYGAVIKRWPLVEFSLTPTPAEPRTLGVERLKALGIEETPEEETPTDSSTLQADAQAGDSATATAKAAEGVPVDIEIVSDQASTTEEDSMSEQHTNDDLSQQVKSLSDAVSKILQHMEDEPAVKNSGYFSQDGGSADPSVKSFGDYLKAVARHDTKRISEVYGVKGMNEDSGAAGGYLVPADYANSLIQVINNNGIVRPRATVIPVNTASGQWPVLDQTAVPDGSGQSSFAGGVKAYWTAEAATIDTTEADFRMLEWRANKLAARTEVSSELIADSAIAIETLLTDLFGRAIAGMEDYSFLRGNGVNKPLGILSAAAAVGVTPDTNSVFAVEDAVEMVSRFQRMGGDPVWIMHPSMLPDLAAFEVGTGASALLSNQQGPIPATLLGYPVLFSEFLPVADASGCVVLADLRAYYIFARQGIQVAYSEHAAFSSDQGTWRVIERLDGQPALSAAITLGDGGGTYTTSAFVYFND